LIGQYTKVTFFTPPKASYFDVVVGLERSYDPESYAGDNFLLVGSPMPERSKVMTQTKRDALALQVGDGKRKELSPETVLLQGVAHLPL